MQERNDRYIARVKRWDLLVRRAVLGHTHEQLRAYSGLDTGGPEDHALRLLHRGCAARIGGALK